MKGDRLTIATQNVRGLGQGFAGKRKRQELKDLFKHTTPPADVILLQETKLPEAASLNQARFMEQKGGISLWNEAPFSAHSARYKGGTGMIISERLATNLTNHGVVYPGRAQFATF